jgi:hypothetical protein
MNGHRSDAFLCPRGWVDEFNKIKLWKGRLRMMASEQKKHPQNVDFKGIFMSRIYVQGVISKSEIDNPLILFGDPSGIRTRVTGVRGRRPKPLDDGTI